MAVVQVQQAYGVLARVPARRQNTQIRSHQQSKCQTAPGHAERRLVERSPRPLISLSVTAGLGCGRGGQPHPPASKRPRPHWIAPPRRSRARSPLDDPGPASVPGPDRPGSPCTRPTSRPSGEPIFAPRRHPGVPAGVLAHPLRRDPRPASPPRATGPVQQARQTGMPAPRQSGRPVGGRSGHLNQEPPMHKYAAWLASR